MPIWVLDHDISIVSIVLSLTNVLVFVIQSVARDVFLEGLLVLDELLWWLLFLKFVFDLRQAALKTDVHSSD